MVFLFFFLFLFFARIPVYMVWKKISDKEIWKRYPVGGCFRNFTWGRGMWSGEARRRKRTGRWTGAGVYGFSVSKEAPLRFRSRRTCRQGNFSFLSLEPVARRLPLSLLSKPTLHTHVSDYHGGFSVECIIRWSKSCAFFLVGFMEMHVLDRKLSLCLCFEIFLTFLCFSVGATRPEGSDQLFAWRCHRLHIVSSDIQRSTSDLSSFPKVEAFVYLSGHQPWFRPVRLVGQDEK